jgi:hypothetical protein
MEKRYGDRITRINEAEEALMTVQAAMNMAAGDLAKEAGLTMAELEALAPPPAPPPPLPMPETAEAAEFDRADFERIFDAKVAALRNGAVPTAKAN